MACVRNNLFCEPPPPLRHGKTRGERDRARPPRAALCDCWVLFLRKKPDWRYDKGEKNIKYLKSLKINIKKVKYAIGNILILFFHSWFILR
jgi:hypothetical protein